MLYDFKHVNLSNINNNLLYDFKCQTLHQPLSLSDASYKGQSSDLVVLWSAKLNKTSHTISQLRFDPTEQTHSYKLVINEDTSMFDEVSAILPTVIVQFVCYATLIFLSIAISVH